MATHSYSGTTAANTPIVRLNRGGWLCRVTRLPKRSSRSQRRSSNCQPSRRNDASNRTPTTQATTRLRAKAASTIIAGVSMLNRM